jgi:hypothetical protein
MSVTIASLELENVKRVSALTLSPSPAGLTVIGGGNGQGKTSVLDAICFALGGEKFRPGNLAKDGAASDPHIKLTLSNGLIIERRGKNASLKVTDPSGAKAGQSLLDSFVEELALNLPKFLEAKPQEKAKTLLKIIGVGDKLEAIDKEEKDLVQEREAEGRNARRKLAHWQELPFHEDAPAAPVDESALLAEYQRAMTANNANARCQVELDALIAKGKAQSERVEALKEMLRQAEASLAAMREEYNRHPVPTADISTADIEGRIAAARATNAKAQANAVKTQAKTESDASQAEYDKLTQKIDGARERRKVLLNSAPMPLAGLSVEDGELRYQGKSWDCMASSEQLRVGVAIVRVLKPECGFVLLDKLEQMDLQTMEDFGAWLKSVGLQGIATRVSKGEECSIILEDGHGR